MNRTAVKTAEPAAQTQLAGNYRPIGPAAIIAALLFRKPPQAAVRSR